MMWVLKWHRGDESKLDLEITKQVNMKEGGDPATIVLRSSGSENWQSQGKDKLTLVRVSGLPNEVIPSVGVKDSRGDWLFTWSDLQKNNGEFNLIGNSDWSGDINLQMMISQVQENGIMTSSKLKTIGVNVEDVADMPLLRLNDIDTEEDGLIMMNEIIDMAKLNDTDGSEELHIKISGLEKGWELIRKITDVDSEYKVIDERTTFTVEEINYLAVRPLKNQSGNFKFNVHAISTEKGNGDIAENIGTTKVYIGARLMNLIN